MRKENLPHGGPKASLSLTDSSGLVDKGANDTLVYANASVRTVTDAKGVTRTVPANVVPIDGARFSPQLERRVDAFDIGPCFNTNNHFFNQIHHPSLDIMYCMDGTDGLIVITDPAGLSGAPIVSARKRMIDGDQSTSTWCPMTDACIMGDHLFIVGRKIHLPFDDTPTANPSIETGIINVFNIAGINADDPVFVHSFKKTTGELRTSLDLLRSSVEEWYQGIVTDGTYLYVAAQYAGIMVFDWDTTIAGELTEVGYNNTGMAFPITVWESSNIDINAAKTHVILSNHGFGIKIFDITTPTVIPDARDIDVYRPNGVPMRIRDVICEVVDGVEYAFCAPNTDGTYGQSNERGLLAIDITDPATVPTDGSTWLHWRLGVDADDEWDDNGDKPLQGLDRLGDFIYVANGTKGIAVYDVGDMSNVEFLGNLSAPLMPDNDPLVNIYRPAVWSWLGKHYIGYGDGPAIGQAQQQVWFADEITYKFKRDTKLSPKGMPFEPERTNLVVNPLSFTGGQTIAVDVGTYTLSVGFFTQDKRKANRNTRYSAVVPVGGTPATFTYETAAQQPRQDVPVTINVTVAGDIWFAPAGSGEHFDWAQVELGNSNTSFVDGTRDESSVTMSAQGVVKGDFWSGYMEFTPHSHDFSEATEYCILDVTIDVNNLFRIYASSVGSGRYYIRKSVAGVADTAYVDAPPYPGKTVRIAWKLDSTETPPVNMWVDGVEAVPPIIDATVIPLETGTLSFGRRTLAPYNPCNGSIANVKTWGNSVSDEFLAGYGKKVAFENVAAVTLTLNTDNRFQLKKFGDRLIACCSLDGFSVIDISDPTAPVELDQSDDSVQSGFWTAFRSVDMVGDTAMFATRDSTGGTIETFSIDPDTGAITPRDWYDSNGTGTGDEDCRFSWISYDGVSVAYASGRAGGVESFDMSDPDIISRIDFDHDTDVETMGHILYDGYLICPNYASGDIAITHWPVDAGTFGTSVKTPVSYLTRMYDRIRPWNCVAEDDLLYVSCNDGDAPSDMDGLAIYDLSDMSAPLPLLTYTPWEHTATLTGAPDEPSMSLTKYGNYIFMGAGADGIAVYDVRNPLSPVYLGTFTAAGVDLNVQYCEVWETDGEVYVAYGNSTHATTDRKIYIDKVTLL